MKSNPEMEEQECTVYCELASVSNRTKEEKMARKKREKAEERRQGRLGLGEIYGLPRNEGDSSASVMAALSSRAFCVPLRYPWTSDRILGDFEARRERSINLITRSSQSDRSGERLSECHSRRIEKESYFSSDLSTLIALNLA